MADPLTLGEESNVCSLSPEDRRQHLRMLEALLFAAAEPLRQAEIAGRMPDGVDVAGLLMELQAAYAGRGVNLRRTDDRWAFRTAEDLAFVMRREVKEERRLSRAALETLAIIAYHQPVTRAEIEEIRGVTISKGTLDVLLEANWVRLRGRRRSPGRPLTFGTTPEFLDHFGLESIRDLPGLADLKAAGLLDPLAVSDELLARADDGAHMVEDEEPLEDDGAEAELRLVEDPERAATR
jgi:segregation and condensation protein B